MWSQRPHFLRPLLTLMTSVAATDRASEAEKAQTALRAAVEGLELELVAAYSQVCLHSEGRAAVCQ
jgi:hypothetical protein